MVHDVKTHLPVQSLRHAIRPDLPQVVVRVHTALTALPKACPARQVDIDPLHGGPRLYGLGTLDGLAIIGAGDDPDVMAMGHLPHPVPAHAWLRTLGRLTGVCRHENV